MGEPRTDPHRFVVMPAMVTICNRQSSVVNSNRHGGQQSGTTGTHSLTRMRSSYVFAVLILLRMEVGRDGVRV